MKTTLTLAMVFACGTAVAQDYASCRTSPNLVGACFTVHGRLYVADQRTHIEWLDSGLVLDVLDRQSAWGGGAVVPADVGRLLARDPERMEVVGFYRVCPLDRTHLGRRQAVCIDEATGLAALKK